MTAPGNTYTATGHTSAVGRAAAVGVFDGVHLGHQALVRQVVETARQAPAVLVPTVFTFDRHPLRTIAPERAPLTLTTAARRSALLVEAGAAEVVVLDFAAIRHLEAVDFLRLLRAHYGVEALVIGFNHHFGRGGRGTFADYRRMGRDLGISVVEGLEYSVGGLPVSSSQVRRALAEGDMALAATLLGHRYAFSGRVVHGRSLGHSIGFPTANIRPYLDDQCLPAVGAYAAAVRTDSGLVYPAMVSIGSNPTVTSGGDITIEAHIMGYEGNLYGAVVELEVVERLRDERRFDSLDALVAQLAADRDTALEIYRKTIN